MIFSQAAGQRQGHCYAAGFWCVLDVPPRFHIRHVHAVCRVLTVTYSARVSEADWKGQLGPEHASACGVHGCVYSDIDGNYIAALMVTKHSKSVAVGRQCLSLLHVIDVHQVVCVLALCSWLQLVW